MEAKKDYIEETTEAVVSEESAAQTEGRSISLTYIMRFRDIWAFTMRHALTGLNGCAFWLVMALIIWRLVTGWGEMSAKTQTLLILCAIILVWMTIVTPTLRSLRQANALAQAQDPATYTAGEHGITVQQGEAKETVGYEYIRKLKITKNYIYAYVQKNSAFIFPKDLMGEDAVALMALLQEKLKR